jgi:hypothetical protein
MNTIRIYRGTRDDGLTERVAMTDYAYITESGGSGSTSLPPLNVDEVQRTAISSHAEESGQAAWDAEYERWTWEEKPCD